MGIFTKVMNKFETENKISDVKKFYLISAAGMPNYGDDMLTRGWINFLRIKYPKCIIYLDALDPIVAMSLYDNVNCVNYLWQLAQALGHDGDIASKFTDEYLIPKRERLMTEVFNEVESIHLVGGGYINELWDANLRLIELVSYFASKHEVPAYATGLGLQPLSSENAEKQIQFIDKFTIFDVRDPASYEVLNQFLPNKISFIGDDYFCFPVSDVVKLVESTMPILRLCIHNELRDENNDDELFLVEICRVIEGFIEKYPSSPIVFYEFRPGSDGVFYMNIKNRFPQVEMVFFEEIWKNGLFFSVKDYFVSTRFHFQLIVSSLGLSGLSYYWSDYYKNKFESLCDVSNWTAYQLNNDRVLDIDDFLSEPVILSRTDFRRVQLEKTQLANLIYQG